MLEGQYGIVLCENDEMPKDYKVSVGYNKHGSKSFTSVCIPETYLVPCTCLDLKSEETLVQLEKLRHETLASLFFASMQTIPVQLLD